MSGLAEVQEAFQGLPARYLGAHANFDATYHLRAGRRARRSRPRDRLRAHVPPPQRPPAAAAHPRRRGARLFVWGSHDKPIPPGFGRHVARRLPNAEQIVLEGCGHVPQIERPERTNGLLTRFFARIDALGAASVERVAA